MTSEVTAKAGKTGINKPNPALIKAEQLKGASKDCVLIYGLLIDTDYLRIKD
ncbi:hypothetical protein [Planktothricoides raciborskii]|uniref:hypothetical protein n=1 Tax=Planktothricoides raciborskii TaxID=132608 RepID=UPI001686D8CE|nr:hypothetical protein [Planktothricoides raciborskii]MBD2585841.1 hypothetical protein [Planktothricoides raciborskii FACHB-1261]